jgi:geranylgeranyl pyrophosphate synthase
MVQTLSRCHFGQGLDITWSKHLTRAGVEQMLQDRFDQKILQMYAYKTGSQVEGVAEMSCIIAKASARHRRIYGALGRVFGVAFQIIDDIHNFSTSPGWTKTQGEDIACGKPTFVIIRALEMLEGHERKRLLDIFCSPEKRCTDHHLAEAVALVNSSGALQCCYEEAAAMLKAQWREFAEIACHNDAKIMLKMLLFSILQYTYDV